MKNPFLRDIDKKKIPELWTMWNYLLQLKSGTRRLSSKQRQMVNEAYKIITRKVQNKN